MEIIGFQDFLDLEKVGAVTVKGTTLEPRSGNKGQRAVETPAGMLNCVGLENPGSDYFLQETLPKLKKIIKHMRLESIFCKFQQVKGVSK